MKIQIVFKNHTCWITSDIYGIKNYLKHYWDYHWLMAMKIDNFKRKVTFQKSTSWVFEKTVEVNGNA